MTLITSKILLLSLDTWCKIAYRDFPGLRGNAFDMTDGFYALEHRILLFSTKNIILGIHIFVF